MKDKKLFLLSCIILILFLSTSYCISAESYCISADSTSNRKLIYGPVISSLQGTDISTSKFVKDYTPREGESEETLHFSIDTAKTSLSTVRNRDYVRIEGLKPYGNPGQPQLPFKSFVVTLPRNSKVLGVNVSNVSYRPILNKLDIVPTPFPVARISNEKQIPRATKGKKTHTKCRTCNSESFFPGNLVSYHTGKDNNNCYVFIKFFPMQYIIKSKRAILITDADMTVNYQVGANR